MNEHSRIVQSAADIEVPVTIGPEAYVSSEYACAENERAIIRIASTGPSILPSDSERIFERFHRGKTGENVKGHGLGLSIARELARAHDGELRFVRSDAEWTEFELALPLAKAD